MLAISPNGDDFWGCGLPRGEDADVPGDAHNIGMHLRRLLGRPWLCTGSNSNDLFSVAHAMVLSLSVALQYSQARYVPCTIDTQSCGPQPREWGKTEEGKGERRDDRGPNTGPVSVRVTRSMRSARGCGVMIKRCCRLLSRYLR